MANPTSIKTVYPGIFIRQHTHKQTVNMYVSYKGIVIRGIKPSYTAPDREVGKGTRIGQV